MNTKELAIAALKPHMDKIISNYDPCGEQEDYAIELSVKSILDAMASITKGEEMSTKDERKAALMRCFGIWKDDNTKPKDGVEYQKQIRNEDAVQPVPVGLSDELIFQLYEESHEEYEVIELVRNEFTEQDEKKYRKTSYFSPYKFARAILAAYREK